MAELGAPGVSNPRLTIWVLSPCQDPRLVLSRGMNRRVKR